MKPCLGLDCDGVLADFSSYAIGYINARLGTAYTNDDCTCWDFKDCLGRDADAVVRELMADGACYGELNPLPGAVACVRRLAERYEVWLVTSLPPVRAAHLGREAWIFEHGFAGGILGTVVAHGTYKARVAEDWPMVAFVEDNADTAMAIAERGIPSYLVDRPYNRAADLTPGMRRGTLEEITEWLL